MTREEWKERLPLIQAFVDGKTIQFKHSITDKWEDTETMEFGYGIMPHRIKPSLKRIPLTKEDFDGHPVIWVKNKYGHEDLVDAIRSEEVYANSWRCLSRLMSEGFKYSFDRITWKPCYKEVEE